MISHEIIGDDMQAVVISLAAGDEVRAEAGAMTYMTDGIEMDARVAFDPTVGYDIEFVGGIKTALLGGEELFFTSMTGPGRVWSQTLPFSRLADRIMRAHKGDKEDVKRDFGGTLGDRRSDRR